MIRKLLNRGADDRNVRGSFKKLAAATAKTSLFEPLESRQLFSAVGVADDFLNSAAPLGNFHVHSHVTRTSSVGGAKSDDVFGIDVTTPVTLTLKLSNLKQSDTVTLMFPDGSVISSLSTNGATARMVQSLSAGQYYVDVSHGAFAARIAHKRLPAQLNNFTLSVQAAKASQIPAPTPQADFAGFGASNGPTEPALNLQKGVPAGTHYQDFSADPLFGPSGPSPDDIEQNYCGDCYFLCTLSAIARTDPGLIEQDVQSIGNGQYKVKFERSGQDVWETVDGMLPVDSDGNLVMDGLGAGNSIWACIMEKAFCYFRKPGDIDYGAIESGFPDEVLKDLGSSDTLSASIPGITGDSTISNGAQLVSQITTWQQAGRDVLLVTLGEGDTTTLSGGHAYSVVGITAGGQIELRNPWGEDPTSVQNPAPPYIQDGGYVTLDPNTVYADTQQIFSGTLAQATPIPQPQPQPTSQPASVSGTVYNDVNKDQTNDSGDPGIAGVMVYVTTTSGGQYSSGDLSATTDSNGQYTINGLVAGTTFYVYEVSPTGWDDTASANGYHLTAVSGDSYGPCDFGNTQTTPAPSANTASVAGTVYVDLNDDQTLDNGDPGIAGVTIYATTTDRANYSSGDLSAVTDTNGQFTIDGLTAGVKFYIYEVTPNGYQNSSGSGAGWYTTLDAGVNDTGYDFGNTQTDPVVTQTPASVSGTVFNDLNDDQTLDSGDPGIAGVTLYATMTNNGSFSTAAFSTVSDSSGNFTISGLMPGVKYYIYEVAPNGYVNSSGDGAGYYATRAASTVSTGYDFGNIRSNPDPSAQNLNICPNGDSNMFKLNGSLGSNAVTLNDGTVADVYVLTAQSSGSTLIGAWGSASNLNTEIEVVDFDASGSVANITTGAADGSSLATADFQATAGHQYEVLIASEGNAGGNYTMYYFTDKMSTPEQLAPAWFSASGGANDDIITAPNIAPISGTIFASLPDSFGSSPISQNTLPSLNSINGNLGSNSFTLKDGSQVDAYNTTAGTSAYTTIAINSGSFTPQVEVLEFSPDGTRTNSWIDTNSSNGNTAMVSFQTTAGNTYEIVVAGKNGATGNYSMAFDANVVSAPVQILPFS